ncbi:MAG: hypothetical protein K0R07_2078 [Sedimentibacter sp.]|jgi:hypothetical protein|nr:hypothetical protein [Sedimentibacter sp.]
MNRRQYDHDKYDKMYDMIELIYLLNRLTNNSYVDEGSKKYLIGMLENVESIKSNFDRYRDDEPYGIKTRMDCSKCDGCYSNASDSFLDRIIFYLKTLND